MTSQNLSIDDLMTNDKHFATKVGQRGQKFKHDRSEMQKTVGKFSFEDGKNCRAIAAVTGVPVTTSRRMAKKERVFRRHTSALKPVPTEENELACTPHCIDEINPVVNVDGGCDCELLFDCVDIDEKWFHLACDQEGCIICD